jgi:hypothetical protein
MYFIYRFYSPYHFCVILGVFRNKIEAEDIKKKYIDEILTNGDPYMELLYEAFSKKELEEQINVFEIESDISDVATDIFVLMEVSEFCGCVDNDVKLITNNFSKMIDFINVTPLDDKFPSYWVFSLMTIGKLYEKNERYFIDERSTDPTTCQRDRTEDIYD